MHIIFLPEKEVQIYQHDIAVVSYSCSFSLEISSLHEVNGLKREKQDWLHGKRKEQLCVELKMLLGINVGDKC